jgi:hypothetical protein
MGSGNPPASANVGLAVALYVIWAGVMLAADFLAFLMFAFADSPGSAGAAQAMIVPVFAWFAFTFVAGAVLLIRRRMWRIVLAFVLAASPPFVVFAGYNLLDGAGGSGGRSSGSGNFGPAPIGPSTAPVIRTPSGGFAPKFTPPEQPDFRKYIPVNPTTRPATTQSR